VCGDCWKKFGEPTIWNEDIAAAVELLKRLYELEPTGGPLHVEVDDWNIHYDMITPVYEMPGFPDHYSVETHEVCDKLAALLTVMPVGWRASVLAHQEDLVVEGMPQRPWRKR
jgi:hypothetical protein